MFHVERLFKLLFLGGCLAFTYAEDESVLNQQSPTLFLPMATDNEFCKENCQRGIQDLLLGWEESADVFFSEALSHDSSSALAYAGKILTSSHHKEKLLCDFKTHCQESLLLPQESFLVELFLLLGTSRIDDALHSCQNRAETYRADKVAALWRILLLHSSSDSYDYKTNQPGTAQQNALNHASALYHQYPNDALCSYMRAYIEENAPHISEEAQKSAYEAVTLLPQHPSPHLLYGHILYRSGQCDLAIDSFNRAAQLASQHDKIHINQSILWWKARLYHITSLWKAGRYTDSKKILKALCAYPYSSSDQSNQTDVYILRQWELNTLALRLLTAQPTERLTNADIHAASSSRQNIPYDESHSLLSLVYDCLSSSLYARINHRSGRIKDAQRSLKLAEKALSSFEHIYQSSSQISPQLLTPILRAHSACVIAVNLAKSEIFSDTSDLWKNYILQHNKPSHLLLPPSIPLSSAYPSNDRAGE